MDKQLVQKAKEIIEKIIYITLATTDADGNPWSTPVFAAFDQYYNFYWRSGIDAIHSQNIIANRKVFISIYDSTSPWGTGEGIFMQAKSEHLLNKNEINQSLLLLEKRAGKSFGSANEFMDNYPRRVYKAIPEKIWINADGEINGKFVDKRIEIKLH